MDKEIIIDGVNVAECCYYEDRYDTGKWCDVTCTEESAPAFRCENIKDCYFKQLKRLEQENEELKSRNENLKLNLATYDLPEIKKVLTDWRTGELDIKFKKLQKENEKLKQENRELEQIVKIMLMF